MEEMTGSAEAKEKKMEAQLRRNQIEISIRVP